MVSQVESYLRPDKQGTPEEGCRKQWPKHCVTINNNKDEDNEKTSEKFNNCINKQKEGNKTFKQMLVNVCEFKKLKCLVVVLIRVN